MVRQHLQRNKAANKREPQEAKYVAVLMDFSPRSLRLRNSSSLSLFVRHCMVQVGHKADVSLPSAVIPSLVTHHHCRGLGQHLHQHEAQDQRRTTLKEAEVFGVPKL